MEQHEDILKEFLEVHNEANDLKEKTKMINDRKKELEEQVIQIMNENGISSFLYGKIRFVAQPTKKVKKPSKKEVFEQVATNLGAAKETVEEAVKNAEKNVTIEFKTRIKPVKA